MMFFHFLDNLKRYGLEYFNLYYGIYRARVNEVPEGDRGALRVIVPAIGNSTDPLPDLAHPMTGFAGNGYGSLYMPEKDDTVWVQFEGGNPRCPLWTGGWYGKEEMPAAFQGKAPKARGFVTPSGHQVVVDEADGKIQISYDHGDDGTSFIAITDGGEVIIQQRKGETLLMNDDSICLVDNVNESYAALDSEGIKLVTKEGDMVYLSKGGITVLAQGDLALTAKGVVNIDSGTVNLAGNIQPAVKGLELVKWLSAHTHIGNFGAPTPINPADLAQIANILSKKVKLG